MTARFAVGGTVRGASLVVEGGGMRGFFAGGLLKRLLDEGIRFGYVIGVSSGALVACAYVAERLDLDFAQMRRRSTLGFFNPRGFLHPLEGIVRTDAFIDFLTDGCHPGVMASGTRLLIPATDAQTGELAWWDTPDYASGPDALRDRIVASASIPFVMPQARVDGRVYADGGIRDSIPIDRAEDDGFDRHVVVLSRPRGYVKGSQHLELYLRHVLKPYPALKQAMLRRHEHYNFAARRVERAEDEGRAFVFRMDEQNLGRFEWSPVKFEASFEAGYRYAETRLDELAEFLERAAARA